MSPNEDDAGGASPPPPSAAADAAPVPAAVPKPSTYVPMGALRGGECADLLALVAAVTRPLEDAVADFRARVAPERRLRFGSAVSFVLEVRAFSRSPRPSPPPMPCFRRCCLEPRKLDCWVLGFLILGVLGPSKWA
jgi:hypothetical protein